MQKSFDAAMSKEHAKQAAQPRDDQATSKEHAKQAAQPRDDQAMSKEHAKQAAQPRDDQAMSKEHAKQASQPRDDQAKGSNNQSSEDPSTILGCVFGTSCDLDYRPLAYPSAWHNWGYPP